MSTFARLQLCFFAIILVVAAGVASAMPSVCPFPQYYQDTLTFSGNGCTNANGLPCLAGSSVGFQITGSYALGACDTVRWDFGDGSPVVTNTSMTMSHTYAQVGRYFASALIVNSSGFGGSINASIGVTNIAGCPQRGPDYALMTFSGAGCASGSNNNGGFGQPVTLTVAPYFTGSLPYEACDAVTWAFGDGTTSTTAPGVFSVQHTYTLPGTYFPNATIKNAFGTAFTLSSPSITTSNGTVNMFAASSAYVEGSIVHVEVLRTNPGSGPLSVNYATSDGSAHAPQDYQATSGTLNFATGESTKSFEVKTNDDSVFTSANRSFLITLSNPTNGYLLGSSLVGITITENDFSVLGFSQSAYNAWQSDGVVNATVVRTGNLAQTSTVTYSVSSSTFSLIQGGSGLLTFAPGETSKTFPINLNQFDVYVGDTSATLTLFNPSSNTNFGGSCPSCSPFASVIVKDSHPRPMLSADDTSVFRATSGQTLVPVTIRLSVPMLTPTTGTFFTADGTATAGVDYVTTTGSYTIPAGQSTTTVSVPVIGRVSDDPDKFFKLNLTLGCCTNAGVAKPAALITILSSTAGLSPGVQNVALGTPATLTLTLDADPVTPMTVDLGSSNPGVLDMPPSIVLTSRHTKFDLPSKGPGNTTVTAFLPPPFNVHFDAVVHVFKKTNLVIKPEAIVVPAGSSVTVSASFDPALSGPSTVQLKAGNAALIDVPASVVIDGGKTATFAVKGLVKGSTTLTATFTPDPTVQQLTVLVDVLDAPKTPTITQIVPANGPAAGGTNVTVNGANLAAGCTLFFGGVPATNVALVGATSMTATTPAHPAGAVDVLLSCGSDAFNFSNGFTYAGATPAVTSVAPSFGSVAGGTLVRIDGTDFRSGCWPFFDGTAAPTATFVSRTEMIGESPAHAAGKVAVAIRCSATPEGALANGFTYSTADEPSPQISSVSPLAGAPGEPVTVTGVRFRRDDSVKFDTTAAAILTATPDADTVRIPEMPAGDVAITLTDKAGHSTTTGPIFTVLEPTPPHITSATPNSARSGTDIILDGTGFRPGYTFAFGTAHATLASLSYTRVLLRVPDIAPGAYPLNVLNAAGKIASIGPTVYVAATGPSIANIAPVCSSTDGGGTMTVHGSGFDAGAVVTFDGVLASTQVVDAGTLKVTIPAGAVGSPKIVVTNPGGATAVLSGAFAYYSPFDPAGGCNGGGRNRPMRH